MSKGLVSASELLSLWFLEFLCSWLGFTCAVVLTAGLLAGLATKRIRSPAVMVLTVFVLLILLAYVSLFLWLFFTWGQPYIRWKHPICKIK